jgi:hypothetical protein
MKQDKETERQKARQRDRQRKRQTDIRERKGTQNEKDSRNRRSGRNRSNGLHHGEVSESRHRYQPGERRKANSSAALISDLKEETAMSKEYAQKRMEYFLSIGELALADLFRAAIRYCELVEQMTA